MVFYEYDKLLGRTDISRDDRARIATCSLRTETDKLKENYSIDIPDTRVGYNTN